MAGASSAVQSKRELGKATRDAFGRALEALGADHPDLVVSDVMMPKLSGLELVERLKADDATKAIPVILLSAKAQVDDIRAGLDAGADDYVTKPFEPLELVDRVNKLLG